MRFVFISTMEGAPWGGSEELWSQAALRLRQEGHIVSASVHHWDVGRAPLDRLESEGIMVNRRRRIFPGFGKRLRAKLTRSDLGDPTGKATWEWVRGQKPDLICISDGGILGGVPWMEKAAGDSVPFVNIAQCNSEAWWPTDEMLPGILSSLGMAKRCYFVSKGNLQLFERQIGGKLPNAEVVRNPFKVPYDSDVGWRFDGESYRLACVARLEPAAKGQDLLLQVLATNKWRERDLSIHFYGGGPCQNILTRLSESLKLQRVFFHGQVQDIRQIWAENQGLILPSRYEGLPLAVVEAMLCSRMVIVTDVAGNAELVDEGRSGFVAEAPTSRLLDAALESAWQKRSLWRQMGEAARESVRQSIPPDPIEVFCSKLKSHIPNFTPRH